MARPGIFSAAHDCLSLANPEEKCRAVAALAAAVETEAFDWDYSHPVVAIGAPGRPDKPLLVDPRQVPRRRLGSEEGRAALIHAITHIEFNAINLALDAAYRFRDMPEEFTLDWISVAADEARHFSMLQKRLRELDYEYGDFPAHNGLWEMAEKTAHSCLVRMALVPRVLEARGLDVTPGMIERLRGTGDIASIEALNVILEEEVRHVAIGSRWFNHCCTLENKPPVETFLELLTEHFGGFIRGPFNIEARTTAGFSDREMEALLAGIG